jgi:hypothetical protein
MLAQTRCTKFAKITEKCPEKCFEIDILGKSDKSVHQLDVEKNIELDYPTYK